MTAKPSWWKPPVAMAIREDEHERGENRCDGSRGEGTNARRCGHERSMSWYGRGVVMAALSHGG
jgi:hypothetical protein